MHLLDTITGLTLVLSSTLTPFTVWVLVSFIKQVPYEIEEAAIIDGASLPQSSAGASCCRSPCRVW